MISINLFIVCIILDSSLPNSTDEEEYNRAESKYDSSESVADSYLNNEPEYANQERPRSEDIQVNRNKFQTKTGPSTPLAPLLQLNSNPNPNFNTDTVNSKSPYYYSDLLPGTKSQSNTNTQRSFKASTVVSSTSTAPKKFKSFLDDPPSPELISSPPQAHGRKRNGNYQRRHSINERDTFSSTTSDDSNCTECQKRRELQQHLQQSQDESFCVSADYDDREEVPSPAPNEFPCDTRAYIEADSQDVTEDDEMAPHRLLGPSCICSTEPIDENAQYRSKSIFYVHQQGEDQCADCSISSVNERSYSCESDLMSAGKRRIQVYETAFDSTVPLSGSDDHCDIEERIRNIMIVDPEYVRSNEHPNENKGGGHQFNCDYHKNRQISENRNVASTSCNSPSSKNLVGPAGRYASHSPPSTAPMPIKFPEKHDQMLYCDSNQSAPDLPQTNAIPHHRHHGQNDHHSKANKKSAQKKKCSHAPERSKQVRKNKRRQKAQSQAGPHKYSSTESLSSSEGSIESIHSSASDGNRSSISSGSRHSASLSSHSDSDSGARVRYPLRAPVIVHANMNILSPISDKSIQESSEMFAAGASRKNLQLFNENAGGIISVKELNKQTSVDMMLLENQKVNKRRYLQNRASLLLKDEIQGSDSGISLQSRDDSKIKSLALPNLNGGQPKPDASNQSQASNQTINNSGLSLPDDIAQLPFDMPKLRRNIMLSEQVSFSYG